MKQRHCGWLLALTAAWAGCSGQQSGEEGMFLRIGNGAEVQGLDPQITTGVPEHRVETALFEGLASVDPETLDPVPGAAERWDVSEDGTQYTFTLRADAKWSNGDPLTAHDFVYAWQRILEPKLASEYAYMLHCIENAKAYNEGTLTDFAEVGVKALDDRTLEVRLAGPTPYFLAMQVHNSWFPVHKATIEQFGAIDERDTKWTRAGNHVSNGPFMLERWDPGQIITAVRNPHYWGAADVKLDGVHFYPIANIQTEERNFRVGQLDVTSTVPLSRVDVYRRDHPELLHIDLQLDTYYYRFNVTRPPFDDVRVRRAFSMSIDRDQLCAKVLRAGEEPAYSYTPPGTAGYLCGARVPYDVEAARALLAEAGHPGGKGLPRVELLYNTNESHRLIAEAIQQMWKDALGVEVALTNQDWKVYLATLQNLDYGVARSGWVGDFVDPVNYLECFVTGSGNNRTGYASKEYDALIAESGRIMEKEARYAVLEKAEALLLEDSPIAPIYFGTRRYLKQLCVKGWQPNLLGFIPFKQLWIDDAPDGGLP